MRNQFMKKKSPSSNPQATSHSLTRRRFLETSVIAGAGTLLGTAPFARTRQARLVDAPFYKGMCYQPMPAPYNPSEANSSWIFFGSDIAYDCMEPLWGESFRSKSGRQYCGRNDLQTLEQMGVKLLRLYDWEPRNYHKRFLDKCLQHGIKVLAPVSDYFLSPGGGYNNRATLIPILLDSFSNGEGNRNGTDYHPAIAGIIMGNEPNISNPPRFGVEQYSQFTKDWVDLEKFPTKLRIGHPQDFGLYGGEFYPGWNLWTTLLDDRHLGGMRDRLFLATQPQNPADDLFVNFRGTGMGYVQATYNNFGVPLLFTELGRSRSICVPNPPPSKGCTLTPDPDYLDIVRGQLQQSVAFGTQHPEQLLGICHFQFSDKVWLCPTGGLCPTEGSFGTHKHSTNLLCVVNYVPDDFTHWEGRNEPLKPDVLEQNPTYALVRTAYGGR